MRIFCLMFVLILACLPSCNKPVSIEKIHSDQQSFTGMSYFLPKGIVDLTISKKIKIENGKERFEIELIIDEVKYVADPEFHYAIKINHNIFFHDKISVTVDANGFLSAINTTVTDKTPEIIDKIANAPIEIFGGAPEVAIRPDRTYEINFSLDPTSIEDRSRLNQVLSQVDSEIAFSARPVSNLPVMRRNRPDCNTDPCFRTAMPYALELYTTNRVSATTVVSRAVVILPNKHVVGQIALTRAPFVTKKFDLTFTSGMLTKADLDNPSEALAFIQIPINVAKAIVSIPSAMLDFKTRRIVSDNNVLKAQKENLDLQKNIIEAQRKLLEARVNSDKKI